MKKILTSMVIFLLAFTYLFSDTIILKDGNSLTGEILKETDTDVIFLSSLGTITIGKEKVEKIIYDNKGKKSKNSDNEQTINLNITKKDLSKYDPDYLMFKRTFGLGMAFLIPGSILFFGTLAIGTPIVFNIYTTLGYVDLFSGSFYASFMGTGLLLGLCSIPFFIASNVSYERYRKRNISLIGGFDGKKVALGLNIAFNMTL